MKLLLSLSFCLLTSFSVFAQNSNADLETILKNANAQTVVYADGFKDLIATETKTFENYKKDGDLNKRNIIESNFIVYQSQRDNSVISEYRKVKSVDGKSVSDKSKYPDEFFAEVQKTGSVEKELEKVQKESLRYDKTLEIQGLTLLQAPVLSDNFRPYFDFKLLGNETIDGREVYVISYQQTRKSPYVSINEKSKTKELSLNYDLDLPGSVKKSDVFLSGKLWIDANNFQLRREERELTARTENPVILMKTDFEYQPSAYGFLVPKQITLIQYNAKNSKKNMQVNFDYSAFTKTNVEVKVLDDDEEVPQN
jgi:hypothetical protein